LTKRLEYSKKLLLENRCSIDEIAQLCGFSSRYHFTQQFSRYYEFPPVVYRRRMEQLHAIEPLPDTL